MSKLVEALKLRDAALGILRARGELQRAGGLRILIAREGSLMMGLRTPFQRLPEMDDYTKYMAALLGGKTNLPYGLDVWAPKKVLNIEWSDDGAVNLVSFKRGEWEALLTALS